MESLPQEIAMNILSRLPITSLINIKFVCRSWRNLVQDPLILGRVMLSYTAKNDPCLILHSNSPTHNALYAVDFSVDGENIEAVKKICVPAFPEFHVTGSCNGLLCLCDSLFSSRIYIYNPFTMDIAELPETMRHINQQVVVGFGFSSRNSDYKVVRIVCPHGPNARSSVDILSLSSLNWKSLGETPYQIFDRPSQVLVNERLHWPTWPINRNSSARLLVSLDLTDEQFREVPKPECGSLDKCNYHLVALGGCLSASVYSGAGFLEIWVMKEYGVKESWIKQYIIDIPDQTFQNSGLHFTRSYATVICLLKDEKILLEILASGALVTFDKKSGKFNNLIFDGLPSRFKTIAHAGSLLWIDS